VLTGHVNRKLDALEGIVPAILKVILQEVAEGEAVADADS
jgi:hypothetical protein